MKIFPAVLRPPYTAAVPYSGILDFYRVTTHAGHGDRQQCLHAIRKKKKKIKVPFFFLSCYKCACVLSAVEAAAV